MTDLFGTQYAGFIASAYGVTLAVIVGLVVWILWTHKRRKSDLAALEKAGFKRASDE